MTASQMRTAEALIERRGQCTLLANVLLLTQNMLRTAEAGDWDAVTDMEADRRSLLKDCFSDAVLPEHSEIFAEALAAMLHLNEELMAALEKAKADAAERQISQIQTRKGIGHYLDVEPLG